MTDERKKRRISICCYFTKIDNQKSICLIYVLIKVVRSYLSLGKEEEEEDVNICLEAIVMMGFVAQYDNFFSFPCRFQPSALFFIIISSMYFSS